MLHAMFEETFFKGKRPVPERLSAYGFRETGEGYFCAFPLPIRLFRLEVRVSPSGEIGAAVIDGETGEEYTLYRDASAAGKFVGEVRTAVGEVLLAIAKECFLPDVFKGRQTLSLLAHVKEIYGDEPEFLWKNFPDYAVLRRKESGKWYGVLAPVPGGKIGLSGDEPSLPVEILDLHAPAGMLPALIDGRSFFPGWHMNKKRWYTVLLDGAVPEDTLFRLLEESYRLAK